MRNQVVEQLPNVGASGLGVDVILLAHGKRDVRHVRGAIDLVPDEDRCGREFQGVLISDSEVTSPMTPKADVKGNARDWLHLNVVGHWSPVSNSKEILRHTMIVSSSMPH